VVKEISIVGKYPYHLNLKWCSCLLHPGWDSDKLYNGVRIPSARTLSVGLISTPRVTPDETFSHMVMQWGQFIDHDIDFVPTAVAHARFSDGRYCNETCESSGPCFAIGVEENDPRIRRHPRRGRCIGFVRSSPMCGRLENVYTLCNAGIFLVSGLVQCSGISRMKSRMCNAQITLMLSARLLLRHRCTGCRQFVCPSVRHVPLGNAGRCGLCRPAAHAEQYGRFAVWKQYLSFELQGPLTKHKLPVRSCMSCIQCRL
jgi:Animal haem peroxidase